MSIFQNVVGKGASSCWQCTWSARAPRRASNVRPSRTHDVDASSHVPHFAEVCNIDGQSFQRQTKQRLAFGVDENTAYFWRPGGQEYEVVGENGVVIYEGTVGDAEKQVTTMHFLTQGDTYSPTTGDVTYSSDKKVCGEGPRPSGSNSVRTVEKHKLHVSFYIPRR